MKILITGGAGFIGSNLALFHLSKKDEVYIVDNFITGSKKNIEPFSSNSLFHTIEQDIISYDFHEIPQCDIIYHLASPASPIKYKQFPIETLRVNSEGTKNTLEFLLKSKSKTFVLASTSEVYGDPEIHPQTESYWGNVNPIGVRSCYDEGKRYAESLSMSYFRKYNIDIRIARIFNTYGPHMEQNDGRVVSNFIMQSLTNKPITVYGDGKQTRSFCFISDLVNGLYLLGIAKNLSENVFNLGNDDEHTISEFAQIIKNITKTNSSIENYPIGQDDPKRRKPDISKAKKILHWEPTVTLQEGLIQTIEYFKNRYL